MCTVTGGRDERRSKRSRNNLTPTRISILFATPWKKRRPESRFAAAPEPRTKDRARMSLQSPLARTVSPKFSRGQSSSPEGPHLMLSTGAVGELWVEAVIHTGLLRKLSDCSTCQRRGAKMILICGNVDGESTHLPTPLHFYNAKNCLRATETMRNQLSTTHLPRSLAVDWRGYRGDAFEV